MNARDHILSVHHLEVSFAGAPRFTAVKDLSFSLGAGETLAIVGESGSGKSLTALALMDLQPPAASVAGTICLGGRTDHKPVRGKDIGMVFQEPMSALNPVMKIGKQLTESILTHQHVSREAAKSIALEWLSKVQLPDPEKIYHRFPHQVSGGQKQRVLIAMAMCNHPEVLIADEPTTALDVTVQKEILLLMRQLQQEYRTAIIFITHDLTLAHTIANDVLVMYRGEMMEYGPAREVLSRPRHPYTKALLLCRPTGQQAGRRLPLVADFWHPEAQGHPLQEKTTPAPAVYIRQQSDEALLEINNLDVWFPVQTNWLGQPIAYYKAVNDVSFTLKRGEVMGLAGESGCGKSTLSRALMGLTTITGGAVRFKTYDLAHANRETWMQVRRRIQMIFQDPSSSLNPRLTVGTAITEPLRTHSIVPVAALKKEALRLLDLVQLPASSFHKYPHQFSGGQRQRIGIARALALRPELLICDESVSALDVSIQAQILNLLKDLQAEFGLTYLFISHDLSVIRYISDRVMIMQAGAIVESGITAEVFVHPQHPYTQKLLNAIPEQMES